jgi:hypothetical protein
MSTTLFRNILSILQYINIRTIYLYKLILIIFYIGNDICNLNRVECNLNEICALDKDSNGFCIGYKCSKLN